MQTVEMFSAVDHERHLDVDRISQPGCLLEGWVGSAVMNSDQLGENDVVSTPQVPHGHLATMATG